MGNVVGLKFMLKNGGYLQVPVYVNQAREYTDLWMKNSLTGRIGSTGAPAVEGLVEAGTMWAVDCADISAMHTFSWDEIKKALPQQQPYGHVWNPNKNKSGMT